MQGGAGGLGPAGPPSDARIGKQFANIRGEFIMFDKLLKGFIGLVVTTCGAMAFAAPVAESGDAGALPASAQVLEDLGSVSDITGRIGSTDDVDMFRFGLDGPATVSFTVGAGSAIDGQLFLFDASGAGLWANDDLGSSLDARITVALASGDYYLAVAAWDRYPLDAGGLPLFGEAGGVLQPAINPNAIAAWGGAGGIGDYTIAVSVTPVPEPATWVLTGAGVAFLLARRQRGRTAWRSGTEVAVAPA